MHNNNSAVMFPPPPPCGPDCLVLQAFKDKSDKVQRNPERSATTLEEICGLELGQWNEGVAFTLAVVCLTQTTLLGFESKDSLLAWEARLRYSLGEGEQRCGLLAPPLDALKPPGQRQTLPLLPCGSQSRQMRRSVMLWASGAGSG